MNNYITLKQKNKIRQSYIRYENMVVLYIDCIYDNMPIGEWSLYMFIAFNKNKEDYKLINNNIPLHVSHKKIKYQTK